MSRGIQLQHWLNVYQGEKLECDRFTKCRFNNLEDSSEFVKMLERLYGGHLGISHNRRDFIVVF